MNARWFAERGGALVVADEAVDDRVPALVEELLAAPERLDGMRTAMLAAARPHAADEIADELIALARA